MFLRIEILRVVLFVSRAVVERVTRPTTGSGARLYRKIEEINATARSSTSRGATTAALNRAALYVLKNEQTNRLKVVHVYEDEEEIPRTGRAPAHHRPPLPRLKIDFLAVQGIFGPELIERLSQRLEVPKNYMFIGTPGDRFPHRIEALGGVRIIL